MSVRWPMVLAGMVLTGSAAVSASVTPMPVLPCAPPFDTPLRLTVRQSLWLADGKPRQVSIERRLVFRRDPAGGTVLDATLTGLVVEPNDPAAEERLRAGMGAVDGPPLRITFDPLFRVTGIIDMGSQWQAYVDRQRSLRDALARAGRPTARADAMLAALATMAPEERRSLLAAFAGPLVHHCGTVPPADAVMTEEGLRVVEAGSAPGMQDRAEYRVDPATGLMRSLDRVVTVADAPLQPLKEAWTLAPE